MALLIFGHTGQVASELKRLRPDAVFLGRKDADLSHPEACVAEIAARKPAAVINAAAYTAVDRAEEEELLASLVNAEAPGAMARECARQEIPFIHVSTDYVFDGSGQGAWTEADVPSPKNAYGRTKLAGENAIRDAAGVHAILRTSWVFSAHGNNFVKTMLRLSESRKELSIVEDQVGGPTFAGDIAEACVLIAESLKGDPDKTGTYNFSGAPDVSWRTFAERIFAKADRKVEISGIATNEYPTPASRPLNSRMNCSKIFEAFGIGQSDWDAALDRVLAELGAVEESNWVEKGSADGAA